MQSQIGIIGMGVMGKNLALNIESRGYRIAIYNRSPEKTYEIISKNSEKKISPYFSIKEFVFSLEKPRCIFLMITSGKQIDNLIEILIPYLNINDILIDGGNSFYKDTIRRNNFLSKKGIKLMGVGISGGEYGALTGPALMPGGDELAYKKVESVFKKISAYANGDACVSYIGPDGSGHYVKMIHNALEYGDMQLISEAYSFLKNVLCLTNAELGNVFYSWNEGELNSYLIEITKKIIVKKDHNNNYFLNSILDFAENKGTGSWASQDALSLGVPLITITGSVFFRYLSTLKQQRIVASKKLFGPSMEKILQDKSTIIEKVRRALYFSKIILYAQGFFQLKIASEKYNWNLNYKSIAKIFRSGCIIRSKFLENIIDIYSKNSKIDNLLISSYCCKIANNYQTMLRDVVIFGIQFGIPMIAFSSAISYYDCYRSEVLSSAGLIQAQRDFFGAHTYQRFDKIGKFHTIWI